MMLTLLRVMLNDTVRLRVRVLIATSAIVSAITLTVDVHRLCGLVELVEKLATTMTGMLLVIL